MSFKHIDLQLYGESHSSKIGFILKNIVSGIEIDMNKIDYLLTLRQKNHNLNTKRNNLIKYEVISGIKNNKTTSRPIVIEVINDDVKSSDYNLGDIRPSHADYVGYLLDGENYSYEGSGIFSGRMTLLYVIAGEICRQIVEHKFKGIKVCSHLSKIGNVKDDYITESIDFNVIKEKDIQVINDEKFKELLKSDTNLSGEITTVIYNIPALLGGYFFDNIKSEISSKMLSIPATRSISFGNIDNDKTDKFYEDNNIIYCDTNYDGGINGGYTNGVTPLQFTVGYKAPSTNFNEVNTIKYENNKFSNNTLKMVGRHDKLIINRAYYAQEGLMYLILLDQLLKNGIYNG